MADVLITTATTLLATLADAGNVIMGEDAEALADEIRGLADDSLNITFQRTGTGSSNFVYRGEWGYAAAGRSGPLCLFLEGTDPGDYFTKEGAVEYRFTSGNHLRPAMITVTSGSHSADSIVVTAQPVCFSQLVLNFCQKILARNADRPRVTSAGVGYDVDGLPGNIRNLMKQVQGVSSF